MIVAVGRDRLARALGLSALLGLGACGGPALPPDRLATGSLPVDRGQAVAWLSTYRKAHGLSAVREDPALDALAQAQASAMAAANTLSHTVAGALPSRLAAVDRAGGASAENVSAGYHDLAAALGGWQRSSEHNANLLYAPVRRIGVAGASAPGTRYKTFWALVMTD